MKSLQTYANILCMPFFALPLVLFLTLHSFSDAKQPKWIILVSTLDIRKIYIYRLVHKNETKRICTICTQVRNVVAKVHPGDVQTFIVFIHSLTIVSYQTMCSKSPYIATNRICTQKERYCRVKKPERKSEAVIAYWKSSVWPRAHTYVCT